MDPSKENKTINLRSAVGNAMAEKSVPKPQSHASAFKYGDIHMLHNETGKALRLSITHLAEYLKSMDMENLSEEDVGVVNAISVEMADKSEEFSVRYNKLCETHSDKKAEENISADDVIAASETLHNYHTLSTEVGDFYTDIASRLNDISSKNEVKEDE